MPRDGPIIQDIFANYLRYSEATESPSVYHRWSYLTSLGALIGRKSWINHGHFRVFPTLYTMLLGEPACRKSSAIKMVKKLLISAGYSTLAADKSSKEKFLVDLEGLEEDGDLDSSSGTSKKKDKYDLTTAENIWGSTNLNEPREIFIVADEFNEFAGPGNMEFYTTLGNFWDFDSPDQPFTQRLKSKSVSIYQPTVSLLSGNTPELFSRAFPPEAIGSGFLSRLLLIHGEKSRPRITWPPPPDKILGDSIVSFFRQILSRNEVAEIGKTKAAYDMLDNIYQDEANYIINDVRFKAYNERRFTQLLRICVIIATAKFQDEITDEDVLQANTILSHAETLMPKAMGEFGKSKNSDVVNKIMQVIDKATSSGRPISTKDLWKEVVRDLPTQKDLQDIIQSLLTADRIQTVSAVGGMSAGFLSKKAVRKEAKYVDWGYLSREERDML